VPTKNILTITQGNTERPEIKLSIREQPITASDVKEVELTIESEGVILTKMYPEEAQYDEEKGAFCFPLSQQDTFTLTKGKGKYQVRVLFNDGTVKSIDELQVKVKSSLSKAVLS
jgi:hypothetical protein